MNVGFKGVVLIVFFSGKSFIFFNLDLVFFIFVYSCFGGSSEVRGEGFGVGVRRFGFTF